MPLISRKEINDLNISSIKLVFQCLNYFLFMIMIVLLHQSMIDKKVFYVTRLITPPKVLPITINLVCHV